MKLQKTKDGINTYFSNKYKQTYHSIHGVLQEADHVFLKGSGVFEKIQSKFTIKILEIGFGTGFNFLRTSQIALQYNAIIEYHSYENDLLLFAQFCRLDYSDFELAKPIQDEFISWRQKNKNPQKKKYLFEFNKNVELNLMLCNAEEAVLPHNYFDAVYHDAFSPLVNSELWTALFFNKILSSMKNGAKLSTYSAKSSVRRSMSEAGFRVEKHHGPKGKREMLVAVKD